MNNKKIIFLLSCLIEGGGERVASELSLSLPDNLETRIVLFNKKVSYPYKGDLISLNTLYPGNFFSKPIIFIIALIKFKKIIAREKPDWVISFGKMPNIINILSSKKAIIRGDVFLSSGYKHFWGIFYKNLVKFLFNKSAKIIVVSQGIKKDFVENFGIKKEKIKVIYNPIDIEKIQRLSKEALEEKYQEIFNNPVIINIGRLDRQKGQWHLIRVFKELKKEIPFEKDIKLVLLGQGELDLYLKNLTKQLNLEKDVFFLGWQKNPFKFLARSKLFVSSSIWEGLGMAILEAMACGVPVVSTDCKSGPREILYPNNGVLISPLEPELISVKKPLTASEKILKQEVIKLFNNRELRDSLIENSKRRIEDFRVENIIKDWSFLWQE